MSWIVVVGPATENLPLGARLLARGVILGVAALAPFLTGVAVTRRAVGGGMYLRQFMTTSAVLSGAIIGGVTAVSLTGMYLLTYGAVPTDPVALALYVLVTPVLGLLGAVAGGLIGLLCALIAGTALRLVSPIWR